MMEVNIQCVFDEQKAYFNHFNELKRLFFSVLSLIEHGHVAPQI